MVSALYGMDCPNQLQHHMKGFLFNGGTREELIALRDLCLGIAVILGVQSRYGECPIPSVEAV
jgi:alkylhydroperoxidase/carboxymuconolactone decarboxylase family protein YurZ